MKLIDRVNNCIAITGSGFYATSLLTELINVYIEMQGDMGILCDEIKQLKKDNRILKKALKAHGEETAKGL